MIRLSVPAGFRFEPVKWATLLLAGVTALIAANELVHDMTGVDIVPAGLTPYLLGAEALLGLLLGKKVRDLVTPLARPRDNAETPLVPKWAAQDAPTPPRPRDSGEGIGGASMRGW